jgi:hypothetical protein
MRLLIVTEIPAPFRVPLFDALAAERGIDVSGAKTKADVIAAMRARP